MSHAPRNVYKSLSSSKSCKNSSPFLPIHISVPSQKLKTGHRTIMTSTTKSSNESPEENMALDIPPQPHHALGIAEIVRAILVHLPVEDLFLSAPRVCKAWRSHIYDDIIFNGSSFSNPYHGGLEVWQPTTPQHLPTQIPYWSVD
jgi:hypothetical protein